MSLSRMYTPVLHFDDINGRPLVGGKLYTYEANSSTPAPTYRDKSGTLLNENPISLDERGECEVWLVDGLRYKMVLVDPIGTQVWKADDVSSSGSGSSSLRRINIFSSEANQRILFRSWLFPLGICHGRVLFHQGIANLCSVKSSAVNHRRILHQESLVFFAHDKTFAEENFIG